MQPFSAPIDDIMFSLRHVARAPDLPGWDDALTADILRHFGTLAQDVLAPINGPGDAQGARMTAGRVRMPDGFAAAYAQLAADGWQGIAAPESHGGMAQPPLVCAAVSEIFSGANHALQMVCALVHGATETLLQHASADQQARFIPPLVAGDTLVTMCLTEADAGSDLSRIACRATADGAGWHITGDKIFISGGDQDLSRDILHLVLARTDPGGVAGLSLFLCPAAPQVRVIRLEEKLGLHASPTCQMRFDGAAAELLGQRGGGLQAMFTLMTHARIDVALQGVAHAARAYDIARHYAGDRVQGRKADGSPARLSDHADVARMLDRQQALAFGARAMCHLTLRQIAGHADPDLIQFLTPLCKIFGSEAGITAADLGIQIMGGYGYLTEYGMAQVWRDARITAIYEGANGIHARALATRGLRGTGPEGFSALIADLADGDAVLLADLGHWQQHVASLRSMADTTALAHDFAARSADLFYRAVWLRIAASAQHHPDPVRLRHLAAIRQGHPR